MSSAAKFLVDSMPEGQYGAACGVGEPEQASRPEAISVDVVYCDAPDRPALLASDGGHQALGSRAERPGRQAFSLTHPCHAA